ncbi:hypothetical protein BY996DRAFT_6424000 [Phakopsora pachyrhizi]|nr:hypothetical protein BY996DRAFT_6424000 [Phakopsora pachyrhizi]
MCSLVLLANCLQKSLGLLEGFEVPTAVASTPDDIRQSTALMLARQLKIRLVAAGATDVPKNWSNVEEYIHAIATFPAFNNYLQSRIIKALVEERQGCPSGSGQLSGILATSATVAGLPAASSSSQTYQIEDGSVNLTFFSGLEPPLLDLALSSSAPEESLEIEITCQHQMELDKKYIGLGPINQDLEPTTPNQSPPVKVQPALDESKMDAPTCLGTRIFTLLESFPPLAPVSDLSCMVGGGTEFHSSRLLDQGAINANPKECFLDFSLGYPSRPLDTTIFGTIHKHVLNNRDSSCNKRTGVYADALKKVEGLLPVSNTESLSFDPSSGAEGLGIYALILEGVQQESMLHKAFHYSNSNGKELLQTNGKVSSAN